MQKYLSLIFLLLLMSFQHVYGYYVPDRVAFPPLCLNHFNDKPHKTTGTWTEPCDRKLIQQILLDYEELIPRLFDSKCATCRECNSLALEKDIEFNFPINPRDATRQAIGNTTKALDDIYEKLGQINEKFSDLYSDCLDYHPHPKIYYERGMTKMHAGRIEEALSDISNLMELANDGLFDSDEILTSEMYRQEGEIYADLGIYDKAIFSLSKAIEKDPSNKDAYFQRAAAYFETGAFDLALNDYLTSEKGKNISPVNTKASKEFKDAFLSALSNGAKEAAIDFIPSLIDVGYTLISTPPDVIAMNLAGACYNLMKVTGSYLKDVDWSRVEGPLNYQFSTALMEPGLKRLYENMHHLSEAEQGRLLGYAIGKYGTDIVMGTATFKVLSAAMRYSVACHNLREANRMYALEILSAPGTRAETIAAASERAALKKSANAALIVVKNPNVPFHVMQKKHAWEKLIILTGNVEEDFRKVKAFLEEQNLTSYQYSKKTIRISEGITRREHEKIILNEKVKVVFNEYTNTGEIFLNDAWVVTK